MRQKRYHERFIPKPKETPAEARRDWIRAIAAGLITFWLVVVACGQAAALYPAPV